MREDANRKQINGAPRWNIRILTVMARVKKSCQENMAQKNI